MGLVQRLEPHERIFQQRGVELHRRASDRFFHENPSVAIDPGAAAPISALPILGVSSLNFQPGLRTRLFFCPAVRRH
jgi:hypothetical protein